jgi:nucleolar GTP-binding protein
MIDGLENYYLDNEEWKYDNLPEIMNGKNVYDFIDPDIEAKLNALEEEEERLEGEGFYDSDEEIVLPLPIPCSFPRNHPICLP